jgi:hypothetical protein
VPDKDEYAILADGLREERAKNASDSSMDDEDLQSRTSEETYRAQKTRTIDRDDKNIFLYHESVDDKSSAPSDAGSDQNVNMEGLAQWAIRIEKNCNQLINHITEPTTMNGRVFLSCYVLAQQSLHRYEAFSLIATTGKATFQDNAQDNVQVNTKEDDVPV